MELQEMLSDEKIKEKKEFTAESVQLNKQDLDQEQKVDVNPMQLNTQNLHIHLTYDNDFSCKITGSVFLENSADTVSGAEILIFFGNESRLPVFKTSSDGNGNFVIEDLPPGFYILFARHSEKRLYYKSPYLKVLPGQTVHHSVMFKPEHKFGAPCI